MSRLVVLGAALLASGCAYKVRVVSDHRGATIAFDDGRVERLPTTVRRAWLPFERHVVEVSAPGHRTLSFVLSRQVLRGVDWSDPLFQPRRAGRIPADLQVDVVLVPHHGPTGTWLVEDIE